MDGAKDGKKRVLDFFSETVAKYSRTGYFAMVF